MTIDTKQKPGRVMASEILDQPAALSTQLETGLGEIRAVAARIRQAQPRFVVLAGRGTSDHAALYAKYLIEVTLGLPAGLASLSTLTAYGARPRLDGVLWIAVSQSGGSPDLVDSTTAAAGCGALTVAVTNAPDSPLAAASQLHVDVRAGAEHAVAATKSYTSELLALWLLIDAWRGGDARPAWDLPAQAADLLSKNDILEVADRYRFADRMITTGRGYAYPAAREAALKLMETSYISAQAFSGADFMHGPFAMIDADRPVIAVVPRGVGGTAIKPMLERLAARRADICIVGDPAAGAAHDHLIPLPRGVHEELSPVLEIMPLQRLAHAIAVARGLDPDSPRGLNKVTETW